MRNILCTIFLLFSMTVMCQTADQIITQLVNKINLVTDYSVTANIKADIPLIRVLPVNASIYFKQKDKFKVVSKGIAILPKQGFTDCLLYTSDAADEATIV
jgi:hypothetical protein